VAALFDANPVVRELFDKRSAVGLHGEAVPMHSDIGPEYADALYRTVLERRPAAVLEVGMAFGVSTLAILTGLEKAGGNGRLISVDPFQTSQWKGCGLVAVRRAGLQGRHQTIEDPDYLALPRILAGGQQLDFAYIDGNHTFDYVLLDFWYIDRMLKVGGVVAFNDTYFPAIHKVMGFVTTHRKYEELNVGLPGRLYDYGRLRGVTAGPGQFYIMGQDRYFLKKEHWEPNWDFFADF
jgi:predicted O-methyltransferase YrrM